MSVCYFGTYESRYPRNRVCIKSLESQGITVHECHVPLWELQEHKGAAFGFTLGFAIRYLFAQLRLIIKFITQPHADIIMVGYIGQLDIFSAWLLSKLTGAKLVFNPLVSLYDTVVSDRGFMSGTSLKGRFLKRLDKVACELSDLVILDTQAHISYFKEELGIRDTTFERIWVGADEDIFKPGKGSTDDREFKILFIGKFIPLHGLSKIIDAAKALENDPTIKFTFVGDGQLKPDILKQSEELSLKNATFIDHIEYQELGKMIDAADLVLGIFGDSDKSYRVIPNKLFQALAVGKPVLSLDSPAARELLVDGKTAFLSEGEIQVMVDRIIQIKEDKPLRLQVGRNGLELFRKELNQECLGKLLVESLQLVKND